MLYLIMDILLILLGVTILVGLQMGWSALKAQICILNMILIRQMASRHLHNETVEMPRRRGSPPPQYAEVQGSSMV